MYKKVSNFTSGGVQDREPKNRRLANIVKSFQNSKPREKQIFPTSSYFLINNALLHHFSANWLVHNKNMTKKSVCREAWSPEMTSQTFPVCSFWSPGFVPHRKWNLTLLVHQNTGKENRYRIFFLYLSASILPRFNRTNKKIRHIHVKFISSKGVLVSLVIWFEPRCAKFDYFQTKGREWKFTSLTVNKQPIFLSFLAYIDSFTSNTNKTVFVKIGRASCRERV